MPFNKESHTQAKNILSSRYGKVSEVVNAHVQATMVLPIVSGSNLISIHKFYEQLLKHIQSLETMRNLNTIEGYVRKKLDKLLQIQSNWGGLHGECQQWDFPKVIDTLRQWVEGNPVTQTGKENPTFRRDKNFETRQQNATKWKCVF